MLFYYFHAMTHYYDEELIAFDFFTTINLGHREFLERLSPDDINQKNSQGWTPLMYACNNGQREIVQVLIKKGASFARQGKNKTLLMLAVGSGDVEIAKLVCVLEELEAADDRGWTALFYAVFYGRAKCAEFLISQGANVHAVDKFGRTPIHLALKSEMEGMMALLLSNGDTNPTKGPNTPIRSTPIRKISLLKKMRKYSPNMANSPRKMKEQKENISPVKRSASMEQIPSNMADQNGGTPFKTPPVTPSRLLASPKMAPTNPTKLVTPGNNLPGVKLKPNAKNVVAGGWKKTALDDLRILPGAFKNVSTTPRPVKPELRHFESPNKEENTTPFKTPPITQNDQYCRVYNETPCGKPTTMAPKITHHQGKPQNAELPRTYTPPTVLIFLTDLGLSKYWPIFRDEEVDFETFITFSENNLQEIGIKLYGPRRKIAMAIREYRHVHGTHSRLLKSSFWLK